MCDAVSDVPVTVFSKGAHGSVERLSKLSCQTLGLDWTQKPQDIRAIAGDKTLQGNLDPCKLYMSDEDLVNETKKMLNTFGTQRYIANLGHGVYPDTNPEKVKLFVNTIKEYKNQ
jgi:uroporphyrinogen decarboxylase